MSSSSSSKGKSVPTPPYELKVARTKDEIEACYDIRIEVFSVEQGFPLDTEIDEYDPTATHILLSTTTSVPPPESTSFITPSLDPTTANTAATTSSKAIGTIRYVPSTGKLSRLAIAKDYRKFGFGKVLVEALEKEAIKSAKEGKSEVKDGKLRIICHSQLYVIPFYSKYGYVGEGEEFDEEGAPHVKLVKTIAI